LDSQEEGGIIGTEKLIFRRGLLGLKSLSPPVREGYQKRREGYKGMKDEGGAREGS